MAEGGDERKKIKKYLVVAGVAAATVGGAIGTIVAAPVVIAAAGFGAGGIAAGSLAASSMSLAATSGIGMGAVAALQSAGAAGIALTTNVVLGAVGAAASGAAAGGIAAAVAKNEDADNKTKNNGTQTEDIGSCNTKDVKKPRDIGCTVDRTDGIKVKEHGSLVKDENEKENTNVKTVDSETKAVGTSDSKDVTEKTSTEETTTETAMASAERASVGVQTEDIGVDDPVDIEVPDFGMRFAMEPSTKF